MFSIKNLIFSQYLFKFKNFHTHHNLIFFLLYFCFQMLNGSILPNSAANNCFVFVFFNSNFFWFVFVFLNNTFSLPFPTPSLPDALHNKLLKSEYISTSRFQPFQSLITTSCNFLRTSELLIRR